MRSTAPFGGIAVLALVASCASSARSSGVTAPPRAPVVIADGLSGPTQIADGPDGLLLVAQLNGDENAATGEVLALDVASGATQVLLRDLDKPTGVLWRNGSLWVMVRRGLLRAAWTSGGTTPGPVEVVLHDLPNNGRSEGTLTALADGRVLYETSGTLNGDVPVDGSGRLWSLDPTGGSARPIADHVKNAYAHAQLADGQIVTTDIGDNIADPPVEELDVFEHSTDAPAGAPADLGWPRCPGDRTCAGVVRPAAVFPKSSTPTGVAIVGNDVYVTLFVTGQLMRVSLDRWHAGDEPVRPREVLRGLQGPHTVLARPDGSLWISEHLAGRIVSVRTPTP